MAGFIRSHLAERLIREGHHVIGVDCLTDCYPRWMKERNLENPRGHDRSTLDRKQTRDFTYVDDAVDRTVRAVFADVVGEVFHIGGGACVTVDRVIRMLESILGQRPRVRYVEAWRGDARHTSADMRQAATVLSYVSRTGLSAGLLAQISWSRIALQDAEVSA